MYILLDIILVAFVIKIGNRYCQTGFTWKQFTTKVNKKSRTRLYFNKYHQKNWRYLKNWIWKCLLLTRVLLRYKLWLRTPGICMHENSIRTKYVKTRKLVEHIVLWIEVEIMRLSSKPYVSAHSQQSQKSDVN